MHTVSAWWLLMAFWFGALCGLLLGALLVVSRRQQDAMEDAEMAASTQPAAAAPQGGALQGGGLRRTGDAGSMQHLG